MKIVYIMKIVYETYTAQSPSSICNCVDCKSNSHLSIVPTSTFSFCCWLLNKNKL